MTWVPVKLRGSVHGRVHAGSGSGARIAADHRSGEAWPGTSSRRSHAVGEAPIPSGSYRPSTPGEVPGGGANTLFLPVFAAATPNGTWTLRFRDKCSGDSGSVSAATLFLNEPPPEQPPPADADPPETTITKGPKDKTKKKKATFEFSSSEPGSTFECALDGKSSFKACTSPFTVKVGKGKHTFSVTATDAAGNADATPATDDWKVKKKKKK